MATRRTPLKRRAHRRIGDAAVAAFVRGKTLQPAYWNCDKPKNCRSPSPGERCEQCLEYLDCHLTLFRELRLRPWEPSPLDVEQAEPPDWMEDARRCDDWRAAYALRRELEEAAAQ